MHTFYPVLRSKEKEDKKEEDLALERERLRNKIFEIEFKEKNVLDFCFRNKWEFFNYCDFLEIFLLL